MDFQHYDPTVSGPRRISANDWAEHKSRICQLHSARHTQASILAILGYECEQLHCDFRPSAGQFSRQLLKWNMRVYSLRQLSDSNDQPPGPDTEHHSAYQCPSGVDCSSPSINATTALFHPAEKPDGQQVTAAYTVSSHTIDGDSDTSSNSHLSEVISTVSVTGTAPSSVDAEGGNEHFPSNTQFDSASAAVITPLLLPDSGVFREPVNASSEHISLAYDAFAEIAVLSYASPVDIKRYIDGSARSKKMSLPRLRELSLAAEGLCACGHYFESFELSYFVTKRLEILYPPMLSWRIKGAIDCARSCVTTKQCQYTAQLLEHLIVWFQSTATNDAAIITLSLYLIDLYEASRPGRSLGYIQRVTNYVRCYQSNLPDLERSCQYREHLALKYKLEHRKAPVEVPFSVPGSKHQNRMLGDVGTTGHIALNLLDWSLCLLKEHDVKLKTIGEWEGFSFAACAESLFREFVKVWLGPGSRLFKPSSLLKDKTKDTKSWLRQTYWADLSELDALATIAWIIADECSLNINMRTIEDLSSMRQAIIELQNYGPGLPRRFRDTYLSRISATLTERTGGRSSHQIPNERYSRAILGDFLRLTNVSSDDAGFCLRMFPEVSRTMNNRMTEPYAFNNLSIIPEYSTTSDQTQDSTETLSPVSRASRRSSLSSGFHSLASRLKRSQEARLSVSSKQTAQTGDLMSVTSRESHESWRFSRATGMRSNPSSIRNSFSSRESIIEDAMDTS